MAGAGCKVLVLEKARLVYLANPKTATQSLRAALGPFARPFPDDPRHRHINAQAYARRWAHRVQDAVGFAPETVAVMREPLAHLGSWFRYRQRPALIGHENSTYGLTFAEFIEGFLAREQPPFARIGRQDRFLGFLGQCPPVSYVFDYARLDLLMLFLSERLERELTLPQRNVSPELDEAALDLPPALLARLKREHALQFRLYAEVSDLGVLETAGFQLQNGMSST